MEKNVIAIDLGATSGRVILAEVKDGGVKTETLHRFPTPLVEEDGKFFWDIDNIFDEILAGLAKVRGSRIDSIGIDTWGVDFCVVGKDGKLRRPRAYRDPYTVGVPERFFSEAMPREELYSRTGIQIMNFNSVFQLYAQKRAGELDGAEKILFMPDALSYMLTGKMVCEYTILSTSALMDPRTREFDPAVLAACGMERSLFPDIVMPGSTVGSLKPEFGLGEIPVVAVAGHDTASAVAAVPALDEGFAYLSSGTWSLMGIETPEPVINARMAAMNYTNEGGAFGGTRLLKNITGMWLLEQCLATWRKEGREYSYDELTRMAAAQPASTVLIDPDDPDFAAPQDMPSTIRGKVGALSDAALVRLIYDSMAAKYASVFENLRSLSRVPLETLHIIGGGSKNEFLDQLTSDACGIKVVAGPAEGTALGNIMLQTGLSRRALSESIETKTFLPK